MLQELSHGWASSILEYAKVDNFCEMANNTKKNARTHARVQETGLGGPGRKKAAPTVGSGPIRK